MSAPRRQRRCVGYPPLGPISPDLSPIGCSEEDRRTGSEFVELTVFNVQRRPADPIYMMLGRLRKAAALALCAFLASSAAPAPSPELPVVPSAERARYAPTADPLGSVEAYQRVLADVSSNPTLDLLLRGAACCAHGASGRSLQRPHSTYLDRFARVYCATAPWFGRKPPSPECFRYCFNGSMGLGVLTR